MAEAYARCGPARALAARCATAAPARVEFALHPGGYVRFGDEWLLVAVPRAPRGPLTLIVAGPRSARRCAAATRCVRRRRTRCVGGRCASTSPTPTPAATPSRLALHPGWRAALRGGARARLPPPPRALAPGLAALRRGDLAAAVAALAGRGRGPHAGRRRRARRLRRVAPRRRPPGGARRGRAARRSGSRTCAAPSAASCPRPSRGAGGDPRGRRRAGAAAGARAVALGRELGRCDALGRRGRSVNEIGPNFIARPYRGRERAGRRRRSTRRRCSSTSAAAASTGAPSSSSPCRRRARARAGRARGRRRDPRRRQRRAAARAARTRSRSCDDRAVDTGNASQLARAARARDARV